MLTGLISILSIVALAGVDQLIKAWATTALKPVGVMPFIPGIAELRYILNDGMAFSMLSGKRFLLIGVTGIMLVVLLVMLLLRKMPLLERISWVLIIGGGIGNLIDRTLNGVVVDYINLLFMHFAVFNFADICVCVGVGLLVLGLVFEMTAEKKEKTAEQTQNPVQETNDGEA